MGDGRWAMGEISESRRLVLGGGGLVEAGRVLAGLPVGLRYGGRVCGGLGVGLRCSCGVGIGLVPGAAAGAFFFGKAEDVPEFFLLFCGGQLSGRRFGSREFLFVDGFLVFELFFAEVLFAVVERHALGIDLFAVIDPVFAVGIG